MVSFFSNYVWQIWGALSVLLLVLELLSGTFVMICFAVGAFCACIVSLFGLGLVWQLTIFILGTLLSIVLVRPMLIKWLHSDAEGGERKSNWEAIIGRKGIVSQTIEADGYGRVAIDGDDWKALSSDGAEIQKGVKVIVKSMDSIILTVDKV